MKNSEACMVGGRGILTQRLVEEATLGVKSGTVSLLAGCMIHLSVSHFC